MKINSFNKYFEITALGSEISKAKIVADHSTRLIDIITYIGRVDGEINSKVNLYKKNDCLCGLIETKDEIYHLEYNENLANNPAPIYENSVIMYKESKSIKKIKNFQNSFQDSKDYKFRSKRMPSSFIPLQPPIKDYTCTIDFVIDFFMYNFFGQDERAAVCEVKLWLKKANEIFKRTDFDGDGEPDNIGLRMVEPTVITTHAAQAQYLFNETLVSEYFHFLFSHRITPHCLQFFLTSRRLFSLKKYSYCLGSTLTPLLSDERSFGICAKRESNTNYFEIVTLNVGLMTNIDQYHRILTRSQNIFTLTHEIAHGFGADHIFASAEGYPTLTNILMAEKMYQFSLNDIFITKQSREIMHMIMLKQGGCLQRTNEPVCGNAIIEGDEECDCGNENECQLIDPCCHSPRSDTPCRFKQGQSQCDPFDPCCSDACRFIPSSERVRCEMICSHPSFCNGISGRCPQSEPRRRYARCANKCGKDKCRCDGNGNCVVTDFLDKILDIDMVQI